MRKVSIAAGILLCCILSASVFGQANASLSGTVSGGTGAIVPGVSVTATNDNTGVVSAAVSNATGNAEV